MYMARIYDDVTQLVGGTPLVKLNRLSEGLDANYYDIINYAVFAMILMEEKTVTA